MAKKKAAVQASKVSPVVVKFEGAEIVWDDLDESISPERGLADEIMGKLHGRETHVDDAKFVLVPRDNHRYVMELLEKVV